jgi:hypothetical protein
MGVAGLAVLGMTATLAGAQTVEVKESRCGPLRCDWICRLYGRYSLGKGASADSACTMMLETRQPSASLIA